MTINAIAKRLQEAKHVVVFTGPGVSAESGIPTFRDALTGLWERFDPAQLATAEVLRADPSLCWGWYEWRRRFVRSEMTHCNQQLWMAGPDTEALLYLSDPSHGLALCDIPITADGEAARRILERECSGDGDYTRLSAVRLGHWPVLVMACRHSRLPLPPHLWFPLVMKQDASSITADSQQPAATTVRAQSAFWFSRRAGANIELDGEKMIHFVSLPKWESETTE
ncbi:Sir2 family NAD-dependent protein deacetylase [Pseudomonas umsongensis]|uniref:Sir2 family NAD-dependent protein deacetylase n=1 Tax=Pseudomonas umsongensis TaxID=198618 RepID=UPI003D7FAA39